jgi:16S rRNA (adenine1518-N6/adenine1519-N6)-dimethyltransferase
VSDRSRLDPGTVRRRLRDEDLRARHEMSQNFLADADVLESILEAAAAGPGRRILEIGPGLGVLTEALVEAGAAVTAIELDAGLAAYLRRRLATAIARAEAEPGGPATLRLIEGDALDQDLLSLCAPPYEVVANLPYHVTSPVLHRLLGAPPRPLRLILMVQREVAERLAAAPGRMSYLSVFVQYHASVRVVRLVPAAAFEPAPAVESAVVELVSRAPDAAAQPDAEDALWRLVQAGFRERRKMLHNVLPRQLPALGPHLPDALEATGIDPRRRPQTLSVAEWLALRDALGDALGPADRRRNG